MKAKVSLLARINDGTQAFPFLRKSLLGDLSCRLQGHFEAQAFEPFG